MKGVKYLNIFLLLLCIIPTNIFYHHNILETDIPQSQTEYILKLSIESPYYSLSNIKIEIYDNTTERFNTVNPYSIILYNETYRLKIYNLDTILLFEDIEDQTWTNSYRIIELDQLIKITNNYPYPVLINYTQYNTVYETYTLRPTSDVSTQWSVTPAVAHYSTIDEITSDTGDKIYISSTAEKTDIFGFSDITDVFSYFIVNSFTVFWDALNDGFMGLYPLYIDNYLAGVWDTHEVWFYMTGSPESWFPENYTVIESYTKTEINALQIRVKKPAMAYAEQYNLFQLYVVVNSFHSDNEVENAQIQLNPYDSTVIQALVADNILITDLYDSVLINQTYSPGEHIVLTPDEEEQCIIQYVDQNNHALNFENYITWVNGSLVTDPNFIATRATDVEVITCTLDNATIETNMFLINNSLNYLTIDINTLYLTNNAQEPVNMSFVENGQYQGEYSWDMNTPNLRPSDISDYGNEGMVYLENDVEDHNKVMYLNSTSSQQYGMNAIQIDPSLTGWTDQDGTSCESIYQMSKTLDFPIDNVIQFYDNYNGASAKRTKAFDSGFTYFSFWIGSNDTTKTTVILFYESANWKVQFYIQGGHIYQCDAAGYDLGVLANNEWTHIAFYANFTTDKMKVWRDGVYITEQDLWGGASELDAIQIYTNSVNLNFYTWIASPYWENSLSEALLSYNRTSYITLNSTQEVYAEDFDSGLSGWIDEDGANCESTYQNSKTLDFAMNNILQFYDNDAVTIAKRTKSGFSGTIISYWFACSNTNNIFYVYNYENTNVINYISCDNGFIKYREPGPVFTDMAPLANNTWIHITLQIFPSIDRCKVWLNGIYENEFKTEPTLTTELNKLDIYTFSADSNYYGYISSPYVGNSLSEGLASYHNAESIEWWQKQSNCAGIQFGETIINFADTISYLNDSTLIYNQNQITNEWTHYRLEISGFYATIYRNLIELTTFDRLSLSLDSISFFAFGDCELWIDAVDYSWANNYIVNRNKEINSSEDLWCWDAFPHWNAGYFGSPKGWGTSTNPTLSAYYIHVNTDFSEIATDKLGHNDVYHTIQDVSEWFYPPAYTARTSGIVELWVCSAVNSKTTYIQVSDTSNQYLCRVIFQADGKLDFAGTAAYGDLLSYSADTWYHVRIAFNRNGVCSLWVNGVFIQSVIGRDYATTTLRIETGSANHEFWIDNIGFSWDSTLPYPYATYVENSTYSPLPMVVDSSFQVNPFSFSSSNYTIANYLVGISDLYNNLLDVQGIDIIENEVIYTPAETRQCFVSLSDQRGQYLDWENYKIYLNNTLIYRNYFNAELNSNWNITIKDRFNYIMTSTLHTVTRDENYIALTITLYSLKIYNQQELYIYSNLTRVGTSQYWTEWIAPGEYIAYWLMAGNYQFNVTEYETSISAIYGYTLSGDDYLLITSENTIANAIMNIVNTNTTIGNQITAVNISISNTQTNISNQIVSVNIELNNINSTLDAQLINIQADLLNLNSNITTMYAFMNNSFINLNSSLGTQFLTINTTLSNLNSSISFLIADVETTVLLVNNSIYTAVVDLGTNLLLINNTIQGNLSLILELNPELSAIYTNVLFSKNLTWSTNLTSMYEQFDYYAIKNRYRNESLELQLRYGTEIIIMGLEGQETINKAIKTAGTQFRVKSVRTGEYLENYSTWQTLPDDKLINLGFYDEIIPATPEQVILEQKDIIMISVVIIIALAVFASAYIRTKSMLEEVPAQFRTKNNPRPPAFVGGKEDLTTFFDVGRQARTPKKKKRSWISMLALPLLILIFGIVIVIYIV